MSEKPSASNIRFLVGIMLGGSLALTGLAVWMIAKDQGSPVFVALAGAMLGAGAIVIVSQIKKKP